MNSQMSNVKCQMCVKLKRGFTLLETMIAIAILLVAVVAPMSTIGNSLHRLYFARDQVIAVNLAQEGIEAVRQVRDSNLLAGVSWTAGITPGYYRVTANGVLGPTLTACAGLCSLANQSVYINDMSGFYQQDPSSTTMTPFKRRVHIENVGGSATERKVTSTVIWTTGGVDGSISVVEYIFNWKP